MNRIVSFGLLLAVILITGFIFFKVMAGFFLPLFMAALLVVLFRPLHEWILQRVKRRPKVAALLTTIAILLIVLLPFTTIVFFAANESRSVIRKLDPSSINDKIGLVRSKMGLDMPAQVDFQRMDQVIDAIQDQAIAQNIERQREQIDYDITELRGLSVDLGLALAKEGFELTWDETPEMDSEATDQEPTAPISLNQKSWRDYAKGLLQSRQLISEAVWSGIENVDVKQQQLSKSRKQFNSSIEDFYRFKSRFLGGPIRSWVTEIANPDQDEMGSYIQKGTTWLRGKLLSVGGATTSFIGRFLFGVIIMAIALFSFLLDGPAMLKAVKQLTPLDDDHENELIAEFEIVSRAVVMATLLSALAQGVLASIGFWFAGVDSVMLLMLLTSVLALVPFVGAAAVWIPVCLWMVFVDGRMWPGIFLASYSAIVVSGIDNIIKPFILHGQSNLHPLWALLSVLGGVTALGPIGILVGPMIVVFLQTLLKILQREIASLDRHGSGDGAFVSSTMQMADDRQGRRRKLRSSSRKHG